MRVAIEHKTTYRYPGEVLHTAQYLHLTPRNNASQWIIDWRIQAPGQMTPWEDCYGNTCHTLVEDRPTTEIVIIARGRVDTTDTTGILPPEDDEPPVEIFLRPTSLTRPDSAIRDFARDFGPRVASEPVAGLHALMMGIRDRVSFETDASHPQSTARDALKQGAGVCQDHAHLFIACCRSLGVPARYVGGYLFDGEQSRAYTAGHAWAAAWVNDLGWVAFDVANRVSATDNHIGVAVGLDYNDVAPIRGVRAGGQGEEEMEVAVWIGVANQ
jgi:transglutaminase-like putative cysteine protease